MNLFQSGFFKLHSGKYSKFIIDCDALSDEDINCLAYLISMRVKNFGFVYGVPRGGLRIAKALKKYSTKGYPLIVDDVYTTGVSMEEAKKKHIGAMGAVIFARSKCPTWITPLFELNNNVL